jgi:hypothetical protein
MTSPSADATLTHPWRKSTHSTGGQDCIEVAQAGLACLVRDSKNPDGGQLRFSPLAWTTFTQRLRCDIPHQ